MDDDDNTPDVRGIYETALTLLVGLTGFDVWDTGNSDNEPTANDLAPYDAVVWFSGTAIPAAGPGAAGETALPGASLLGRGHTRSSTASSAAS